MIVVPGKFNVQFRGIGVLPVLEVDNERREGVQMSIGKDDVGQTEREIKNSDRDVEGIFLED